MSLLPKKSLYKHLKKRKERGTFNNLPSWIHIVSRISVLLIAICQQTECLKTLNQTSSNSRVDAKQTDLNTIMFVPICGIEKGIVHKISASIIYCVQCMNKKALSQQCLQNMLLSKFLNIWVHVLIVIGLPLHACSKFLQSSLCLAEHELMFHEEFRVPRT